MYEMHEEAENAKEMQGLDAQQKMGTMHKSVGTKCSLV